MSTLDSLEREAFEHPDHLCNGKCPDYEPGDGYLDSRDPACFYCNALRLIDVARAADNYLRYGAVIELSDALVPLLSPTDEKDTRPQDLSGATDSESPTRPVEST